LPISIGFILDGLVSNTLLLGRLETCVKEVGSVPRKKPVGGGGKYKSRKTGKFVSSYYGKRNPSKVRKVR
jgi:hypothetical protein